MSAAAHVRLVDGPGEAGRTTATLLASLAARLSVLYLVSGADAIGALTAGFAALGREVAGSADGARLRRALESGRPGANGHAIWETLRIHDWASSFSPAPVLDQLRNDVALLLADDLEQTLELLPIPGELEGADAPSPAPAAFADFVLGFYSFSQEVVRVVEALAAPSLDAAGAVVAAGDVPDASGRELLR